MPYKDDCLFCKILKKEIPAKVVYEDDKTLAFDDINPAAPVHTLIIPKIHVAKVQDMTADHNEYLSAMFAMARKVAHIKSLDKDGYRLVINCCERAGQSVFHLHMHLLGGRDMKWPPG